MKDSVKTKAQLISELEVLQKGLKDIADRNSRLMRVLRSIRNVNQLITRERELPLLLRGACSNLVETRGYYNAWIVLLEETGGLTLYQESGLGKEFSPLAQHLKQGKLPVCGQRALEEGGVIVTGDPASECPDCPLSRKYAGRGAMTARLEYGGHVFGLMSVSIPARFVGDEEEAALFKEMAGNIGFALHGITEEENQSQARKELEESRKKYTALVKNIPEAMYSCLPDENATMLYISDRFGDWTGYYPYDFYRDGSTWPNCIHPEDREDAVARFRRAIENHTEVDLEYRVVHRDSGRVRYIRDHGTPIFDERGRIARYDGVFSDVTRLKRAEEKAWKSEKRYRELANRLPQIVFETDADGRLTFVNDRAFAAMGYSREDFDRGLNVLQMVVPAERERAEEGLRRVIGGEGPGYNDYTMLRKDGSTFPAIIYNEPIFGDGGFQGFRGIVTDITEQKQMEEELIRARDYAQNLLENSPSPIIVINPDTSIDYVNPALEKITGFTAEDLIGQKPPYPFWTGEQQAKIDEDFRTAFRRKGADRVEEEFQTRDGRRFTVEITSRPVIHNGQFQYYLASWMDITERKRAEAEKEKLERRAQVKSRLASIGEMASGIAHEINNPLTGVIGFSELLMEKDIPDELKEDVRIINDGAERVAEIVNRLLAFSRQHEPQRRSTDINSVIENTLALRKYSLETNNIEITTSLDPDLPVTLADAGQLQQVFMNIIINAEKEMKSAHGRGRLTVKTEHKDDIIRISFQDDGPGIAEENLEKIFNPFFTTREVGEGTGLGLSLSYGIIAEHNGKLYVKSQPGQGATFFIELPVIEECQTPSSSSKEEREAADETDGRILVMDDEPAVLSLISRIISGEGYKVETASCGEEAIELIKNNSYELLLSDIKLPGLSGIDVYREIGRVDPSLQKRIIFITGDVIGSDTADFLDSTGAPYITKPIDIARLKKEVRRRLNLS